MIGHIFRKDARLLYPLALLVAAIHLIRALLAASLEAHRELAPLRVAGLRVLEGVLPYISMLGVIALTAAVVQQDPLPDSCEDFLIRPIRRSRLLLGKLLFVVLIVVGPVLLADVLQGVLFGFDAWTSFGAAFADALSNFLLLSLPAMMLASVSRNLTELLAGALLLFLIYIALMIGMSVAQQNDTLYGSGLEWIRSAALAVLFLVVGALVLPTQYIRRTTSISRGLIALGGLLSAMLLISIPWAPSFALQQAVDRRVARATPITVAYAPEIGRFRQADDAPLLAARTGPANLVRLFVPLRVEGVAADDQLLVDRVAMRIRTAAGKTVFESTARQSSRLRPWNAASEAISSQPVLAFEQLSVPAPVLARLQGIDTSVELDFFLSVLRAQPAQILSALGGVAAAAGRHCFTRSDPESNSLEVNCLSLQKSPSCISIYLRHDPTGSRLATREECRPNYAPYRLALAAQLVNRFGSSIPLSDAAGSASSHVVIVPYEAVVHVSRHLRIASVQIANWQGEM